MEEKEKPVIDDRPFFMSYEGDKWVLNIKDPATNQITERRVFQAGAWRKYNAQRPRSR